MKKIAPSAETLRFTARMSSSKDEFLQSLAMFQSDLRLIPRKVEVVCSQMVCWQGCREVLGKSKGYGRGLVCALIQANIFMYGTVNVCIEKRVPRIFLGLTAETFIYLYLNKRRDCYVRVGEDRFFFFLSIIYHI